MLNPNRPTHRLPAEHRIASRVLHFVSVPRAAFLVTIQQIAGLELS